MIAGSKLLVFTVSPPDMRYHPVFVYEIPLQSWVFVTNSSGESAVVVYLCQLGVTMMTSMYMQIRMQEEV